MAANHSDGWFCRAVFLPTTNDSMCRLGGGESGREEAGGWGGGVLFVHKEILAERLIRCNFRALCTRGEHKVLSFYA